MLLAGAWVMASSLRKLININPGFDPSNVLTVRLSSCHRNMTAPQALRFYHTGLERMGGLPAVQSATVGTSLPGTHRYGGRFRSGGYFARGRGKAERRLRGGGVAVFGDGLGFL